MIALITYPALRELHDDDRLLASALRGLGIDSRPAVWSDSEIDWRSFEALVVRSPWDYFIRLAEFRAWLEARIASGVRMCNAAEILVWNFDKRYLEDLAASGIPIVPTISVAAGRSPDLAALARARGWDELVIKPTISGGAYATHRVRVADLEQHREVIATTLVDRGLLIQPFVPEIANGELSLLFFDGEFSHAVCKRPKAGDYRVQFQHGGTTERIEVAEATIAAARACLDGAPSLPTYARVDGVIVDGQFLLMELEVFEPLMFLAQEPLAAARFARAIQRRL